MISRLSACAALFAIFATAGLAFAADVQHRTVAAPAAMLASAGVVTLPAVTVIGHRAAR